MGAPPIFFPRMSSIRLELNGCRTNCRRSWVNGQSRRRAFKFCPRMTRMADSARTEKTESDRALAHRIVIVLQEVSVPH